MIGICYTFSYHFDIIINFYKYTFFLIEKLITCTRIMIEFLSERHAYIILLYNILYHLYCSFVFVTLINITYLKK